jgi:quinoprotein dehydrogenase-associated probable ABC transporter substrate-binding protein
VSRRVLAVAAWLALLGTSQAVAQNEAELVSHTAFRVCADPSDLPFSNDKGQGFENRIASLIAGDFKLPVQYTFFPDSQGFVRATLMKDLCDVVMGTAVGSDEMSTTEPYYYTAYMIVTRDADHVTATSLGDPALAGKRFGLIGGTPPTDLMVKYDLMDQAKIYPLMVDTRVDQPSRAMLQDLMDHRIDAALIWAPFAGYFIATEHLPLHAAFLDGHGSSVRLDYHIAMGVRPGATDFRRALNRAILRHRPEITGILQSYGIPLLDEQGQPIPPPPPSVAKNPP